MENIEKVRTPIEKGKEGNISFDAKSNAEMFKNLFSGLAMNLVRQTSLEQIV